MNKWWLISIVGGRLIQWHFGYRFNYAINKHTESIIVKRRMASNSSKQNKTIVLMGLTFSLSPFSCKDPFETTCGNNGNPL